MGPDHDTFMAEAIAQAERARELGEVPVGAVLVHEGHVLVREHNRRETLQDPTAHAEFLTLKTAARELGSWRLENTRLYIPLVCFGAFDPKAGCCGSLMNLLADPRFNHNPEVIPGVRAEECGALLTGFFRHARQHKRPRLAE